MTKSASKRKGARIMYSSTDDWGLPILGYLPKDTEIGTRFFVFPADPESVEAIHRQIRIAIDHEDGTGSGYDHVAWKVMKALGLTDKKFPAFMAILPPPRNEQRRKKK